MAKRNQIPVREKPTLYLVVPPEGQQDNLAKIWSEQGDESVLKWRLDSGTLKFIAAEVLQKTLRSHLENWGNVTVFHAGVRLIDVNLESLVGNGWQKLCKNLSWAEISLTFDPVTAKWPEFTKRLNRPDEVDVRLMFFSDGKTMPSWPGLSSELNMQGQRAHEVWYKENLEPLNSAMKDETASRRS